MTYYISEDQKCLVGRNNQVNTSPLIFDYYAIQQYSFYIINSKNKIQDIDESKKYYLAGSVGVNEELEELLFISTQFTITGNMITFTVNTGNEIFLKDIIKKNTQINVELVSIDDENHQDVILRDYAYANPRVYADELPEPPVEIPTKIVKIEEITYEGETIKSLSCSEVTGYVNSNYITSGNFELSSYVNTPEIGKVYGVIDDIVVGNAINGETSTEGGFELYKITEYEEKKAGVYYTSITFSNGVYRNYDEEEARADDSRLDGTFINLTPDEQTITKCKFYNSEKDLYFYYTYSGNEAWTFNEGYDPTSWDNEWEAYMEDNYTSIQFSNTYSGMESLTYDIVINKEVVDEDFLKLKGQKVEEITKEDEIILSEEITSLSGYLGEAPEVNYVYLTLSGYVYGEPITNVEEIPDPIFKATLSGNLNATIKNEEGTLYYQNIDDGETSPTWATSTINGKEITCLKTFGSEALHTAFTNDGDKFSLADLGDNFTVMGYFYVKYMDRPAFFAGASDYYFGVDGNNAEFCMWAGNGSRWNIITSDWNQGHSGVNIEEKKWYHVAYSYSATTRTYTLFINGEAVKEISNKAAFTKSSDIYLQFGEWGARNFGLDGCMYDLRIYGAVLSEKAIKKIMKEI